MPTQHKVNTAFTRKLRPLDNWAEIDIVETPSFADFVSHDKPLRARNLEIWLAPGAYVASDGIMDSLPIEIFTGERRSDGTFHRDQEGHIPAYLKGEYGQPILEYTLQTR